MHRWCSSDGRKTPIAKIAHKNIIKIHCIIHRQPLVCKTINTDLDAVLDQCVKIINHIRNSAVQTRNFALLCE